MRREKRLKTERKGGESEVAIFSRVVKETFKRGCGKGEGVSKQV